MWHTLVVKIKSLKVLVRKTSKSFGYNLVTIENYQYFYKIINFYHNKVQVKASLVCVLEKWFVKNLEVIN